MNFTADEVRAFERLFADPLSVSAARDVGTSRRVQRERFRNWAGVRFPDFYQRGLTASKTQSRVAADLFREDWHPDGPMAAAEERHRAQGKCFGYMEGYLDAKEGRPSRLRELLEAAGLPADFAAGFEAE